MDEQQMSIEEVKAMCEQFGRTLRSYGQALMSGIDERGKDYPGFWPSDAQAEEFGLLAAKAVGRTFSAKDMQTTTGPEGGFLVPEELSARIIQKLQQYGKLRSNALPVKVGPRQWVPKIASDVQVYAPGEGKTIQASDVLAKMVKLEPIKMAALTVVSRELEEDSLIGIGEIIATSVTRALAMKEDAIGFCGTGTEDDFGMCGIVGAFEKLGDDPASIEGLAVQAIPGAWTAITLGDFEDCISRLDPAADGGAKWYVSRRFFFSVMHRLASATGAADMFAILSSQKARHFMGYEVVFVHCMPTQAANNQIVAILGDLGLGMYLGETRTLEIARSEHAYFASDQVGFRATERVDVNAHGVGTADSAESIVALVAKTE